MVGWETGIIRALKPLAGRAKSKLSREEILQALRETGWVVAGAAERLGLNRSTLNARMRKLEIRRPQPV